MSTNEPHLNQLPIEPTGDHRPADSGPNRRRTGRIVAGVAGALVLSAGLGGAALARTASDPGTEGSARTADAAAGATTGHRAGPSSADIDDLTLGELSDELERLGLEVRIAPEGDDGHDPADPDTDAADGDSGGPDSEAADSQGDAEVDPFDGMTDAEIDALSDEEFLDLLEQAGIEPEWEDVDGLDGADDHDHDGADDTPLASASVDGDRLDTTGLSPEVAEQALQVWNRFVELIPADQRQMISGFELLDEDYQGAHVYPDDNDPTRWILGVGLGLGDDLDYVLIHEFGHLLTLQAEEVPPSSDTGSCLTYHTGEGCALRGSTMAEFVNRFWPQEMRDAVEELYESEDEDAFEAFYQERKDQFVTDYAATNPAEDLAETFAHFVTEDRPTGDSIADQKVKLLWADPDLVELRTQIRSALN